MILSVDPRGVRLGLSRIATPFLYLPCLFSRCFYLLRVLDDFDLILIDTTASVRTPSWCFLSSCSYFFFSLCLFFFCNSGPGRSAHLSVFFFFFFILLLRLLSSPYSMETLIFYAALRLEFDMIMILLRSSILTPFLVLDITLREDQPHRCSD